MILTLMMMILSSMWSIVIISDFEPVQNFKNKLSRIKGDTKLSNRILNIIKKLLTCNQCFSYWLFSIVYLIVNHSFYGFIIGVVVYFLTFYIYKYYKRIEF